MIWWKDGRCLQVATGKLFAFMEEEDGSPNSLSKSQNQSHSQGGTTERNMKKKNKKHSLPLRMFISVDGDDVVRHDCPNASNPFHKCADYCSLRTSDQAKKQGKIYGFDVNCDHIVYV